MTHGEYVISVITLAYVIVAYRTLCAIKHQGELAEAASNAVMDTEGGIVAVYEREFSLASDQTKTLVSYRIHNLGRTIATSYAVEHLLQIGESPDVPPTPSLYNSTDHAASASETIIPPDKDAPKIGGQDGIGCTAFLSTANERIMGVPDSGKPFHFARLTEATLNELRDGKTFLWSYGFIRYRDIFKRRFEIRFCHRYEPKLVPLGGFVQRGPSEFNRLVRTDTKPIAR